VAGSCEYGDEPSGSGATNLVSSDISLPLTMLRRGLAIKLYVL
jgi:hypothetical protein